MRLPSSWISSLSGVVRAAGWVGQRPLERLKLVVDPRCGTVVGNPAHGGEHVLEAYGGDPAMTCRVGCGACCIAPSISSPIPGMPGGKPAGVRCVQLTADHRCRLYGRPERPEVCVRLRPEAEMCGESREEALACLAMLERATAPKTW